MWEFSDKKWKRRGIKRIVKKGAQNWFTWIFLQEAADHAYWCSCVVPRGEVAD